MKGTIVPIKPEVVVKVIECGPLRIGGHVRILSSTYKCNFLGADNKQ